MSRRGAVAGIVGALAFVATAMAAPGQLDRRFGTEGVQTDLGGADWAGPVAIAPSGTIVVAGASGGNFALVRYAIVRYRRDGALDRTFGRDGVVVTDLGGEERAVAARFLPDGRLDRTFARTVTDFGGVDTPFELALQPDGKIVAVGASSPTSTSLTSDVAVARYLSSR